MHTADAYKKKIYVFRGGDGRDYLNDLHEFLEYYNYNKYLLRLLTQPSILETEMLIDAHPDAD